ncbi:IclR family transcriptional regulator [Tepidibacillus infernus]|uniref:IclR family transcriptional regulator n=1 Tax=Tepidibacillus infernus TaxID=1806172 RepID=UPI003B700BE4
MDYRNKTVLKGLEILNYFRQYEQLSIAEMARMTELPKSTLHRMVVTLESEGFLRRVDNSQHSYSLGLSLLELGYLVEQRLEIRKAAFSAMTKLRDQVNEAVNLIVVDGNEAVYIEKVDTSHPVRVYTRVGRRAPLYAGACPRILLSYMDDQEIEQLFNKFQWQKIANGTIVDKDLQLKMIAQTRESGYTVSYNELENGSAAVAMPIRDYTGKVIAGLSIAGPIDRFDSNRLPSLIQELKIAVNEISRNMGFRE